MVGYDCRLRRYRQDLGKTDNAPDHSAFYMLYNAYRQDRSRSIIEDMIGTYEHQSFSGR